MEPLAPGTVIKLGLAALWEFGRIIISINEMK